MRSRLKVVSVAQDSPDARFLPCSGSHQKSLEHKRVPQIPWSIFDAICLYPSKTTDASVGRSGNEGFRKIWRAAPIRERHFKSKLTG